MFIKLLRYIGWSQFFFTNEEILETFQASKVIFKLHLNLYKLLLLLFKWRIVLLLLRSLFPGLDILELDYGCVTVKLGVEKLINEEVDQSFLSETSWQRRENDTSVFLFVL